MVFPSLPVYLDPPNWQQQHNHQQAGHSENPQLLPPISPSSTGNARSIRPTSMAERARMAKIPQPETPLKCPRCESTNTKFCYFNNYSLSQPRHFCKTCRRYWTRGGALRNVPVGGGFRRNKRSKVSTKSQSSTDPQQGSITSPGPISSSNSCSTDMINSISILQNNHLPFIGSHRHNPSDYIPSELGLNFSGIHPSNFSISGNACSHNGIISSGVSFDQWRMTQGQQFPLLTGLDPHTSLYPFENEGVEPSFGEGISHNLTTKAGLASGITQFAPVKMEDHQGMSLSRQLLGVHGNENYWGGNTWTDIPGYNSTSTSNFL